MTTFYDLDFAGSIVEAGKVYFKVWDAIVAPRGWNVKLDNMDANACTAWCEQNCKGPYEIIGVKDRIAIGIAIFQMQEDATLFKLFWA